jgi:hypothetical protein
MLSMINGSAQRSIGLTGESMPDRAEVNSAIVRCCTRVVPLRTVNERLNRDAIVGHAHTTEAIPECIRGGGIREAESNMRLLGIVSATYRLGHSGNYFESRTAAPSVVMSPRGHLAALVNQLEIQKIQTPAATQPICRRFPVRTYRKPVMLPSRPSLSRSCRRATARA